MTVRDEMEESWQRWLEANREAERIGDWGILAEHYRQDATYGWMYSPDEHFMALGREEIRTYALGTEMAGLDGWRYDYLATLIDDRQQMIVGFWKQRSGILDDDGVEYEITGIGGSWFGWTPDGFSWQRDWFDLGSAAHTFLAIAGSGRAPQPLLDRMGLDGPAQPRHYRLADLPSTVWPPPVEEADRRIRQKLRA